MVPMITPAGVLHVSPLRGVSCCDTIALRAPAVELGPNESESKNTRLFLNVVVYGQFLMENDGKFYTKEFITSLTTMIDSWQQMISAAITHTIRTINNNIQICLSHSIGNSSFIRIQSSHSSLSCRY